MLLLTYRGRYALYGTGLARGAISLRACYAMSGTGLAYACYQPTRSLCTDRAFAAIGLRACYARASTEIARCGPPE
eukprot:108746-Rhodomonas_salina.1